MLKCHLSLPSLPMKKVPSGQSRLQMNCCFPLILQAISRLLSSGIISARSLQPGLPTDSSWSSAFASQEPSCLLNFQIPAAFLTHFALALPSRVYRTVQLINVLTVASTFYSATVASTNEPKRVTSWFMKVQELL